jgi:hypothetical protein
MKQFLFFLVILITAVSCGDDHKGAVEKIKFKSEKEKLSYALGVFQAEKQLKKSENFDLDDFDKNKLIEGFEKNLVKDMKLDSSCLKTIELFLGNGKMGINDRYVKEGSYCVGKLIATEFILNWSKTGALNRFDLQFVKRGFKDVVQKRPISITTQDRNKLIESFYFNLVDEFTKLIIDSTLSKKSIEKIDDRFIIEKLEEGSGVSPTDSSDVVIDYLLYTPLKDTLVDTYRNITHRRKELDITKMDGWNIVAPKLKKGGKYRIFFPSDKNPNYSLRFPCIIYEIHLIDVGSKGSLTKSDKTENMPNKKMNSMN